MASAPSVAAPADTVAPRSEAGWGSLGAAAALLSACGGGGGTDWNPAQALVDARDPPSLPELLPRTATDSGVSSPVVASITASELFDWAERQYPQWFPGPATNQTLGALTYREYPGTGNVLGVLNNRVRVVGPMSNGAVRDVGTLQSFVASVNTTAIPVNSDADAARFLLQAQFSASEAEIAAVRSKGYAGWLGEQLNLPLSQTGWQWLEEKGYAAIDTNEYFFAKGNYRHMVWQQLFQAPDAVRKRWAIALSEIFVVSWRGIKDVMSWDSFGMAAYWDLLNLHAFGNYRELLEALTRNPAMGVFLSTKGNARADAATGRLPDENYAREVMQLFSIGLYQLNLDGTVQRDSNGQPIESYTPDDVSNLARVFTGYDFDTSVGSFNSPKAPHPRVLNVGSTWVPMVLDPEKHSPEEKRFLGIVIPAGTDGPTSLRIALDTLANHPNTAPFLCRQFIQRMVTSNPSPAYVARVATVFNNNGAGMRGDLKAVLKAILLDPEARGTDSLNSPTFGRLREPMLRIVQWGRTFKARSLKGTWKIAFGAFNTRTDIAQYPLDPPSVFSFYRPGYVPPGTEMAATGATVPEFQIVNESTVAGWINLLQDFCVDGIYVMAPEVPYHPASPTATDAFDIVPNYSAEKALAPNTQALVNRLNLLLCANQLSPATVALIVNALKTENLPSNASDRARQLHVGRAILFVMSAAEYLVQR